MQGDDILAGRTPLAGRDCGGCNVCCVALTIHDPELEKPEGVRCPNAERDNSCRIYSSRPQTCRSFQCGWRLLKWIRAPLRPDRSGVLVKLHGVVSRETGTRELGVEFGFLTRAALRADGLAESVAAAVAAEVPVFLRVPGPGGRGWATARANDVLRHAVLTRDKPGLLELLELAWRMGRTGARVETR